MTSRPRRSKSGRNKPGNSGRYQADRNAATQPVCFDCVGESYVSGQIRSVGAPMDCAFCGGVRQSIPLAGLAELVNEGLRWNIKEATEEPVIDAKSDKVYYELQGDLIRYTLGDTLLIDEPLMNALLNELAECWDPAFDYADDEFHIEAIEPFPHYYSGKWDEFADSIKHRRRYFDEDSIAQLQTILLGAEEFVSSQGHAALRTLSPGDDDSIFYRARHANSEQTRLAI